MPKGRPTKYKPEFNEQVRKLCLLGATDVQLADFFKVHSDTIQNWKKDHPDFFESIKEAKIEVDQNVADSLYHRALGYSHPDTKAQWVNGLVVDGNKLSSGRWETLEMIKHYPPDTAAAFIWLKNRQGWRDKQEIEHSGDNLQIKVTLTND